MGFSVKYSVERQKNSVTVDEATRNFVRSCECCCKYGFQMDCDVCPVKKAHEDKLEAILELRQYEHHKAMVTEREVQRLDKLRTMVDEIVQMVEALYESNLYNLDSCNKELDALTDKYLHIHDVNDISNMKKGV